MDAIRVVAFLRYVPRNAQPGHMHAARPGHRHVHLDDDPGWRRRRPWECSGAIYKLVYKYNIFLS